MSWLSEERGRLEGKFNGGLLSWRQVNAGRSFIEEMEREVAEAIRANRDAGRAKRSPELQEQVREIKSRYESWRAANEVPERGMFLDRGQWRAR
jgi:hypothetical protein